MVESQDDGQLAADQSVEMRIHWMNPLPLTFTLCAHGTHLLF